MSQNFWYPSDSGSSTVTANQGTPNTDANAWPVRITDGTHDATVTAGGALNVSTSFSSPQHVIVDSSALPSGASTEATLAAFSAKSASAAVHEAYDYQAITYVGATDAIDTVVYKSGGAGGTIVATQTMGYDGSNRLTSVTKT